MSKLHIVKGEPIHPLLYGESIYYTVIHTGA